jgi:serine/threonine protein kinase
MSPELVSDSSYNTKSDIWALGCLIYELCTLEYVLRLLCLLNKIPHPLQTSFPSENTASPSNKNSNWEPIFVTVLCESFSSLTCIYKSNSGHKYSMELNRVVKAMLATDVRLLLSSMLYIYSHYLFLKACQTT